MSERYKKEIEEILRQSGELAPAGKDGRPRLSVWRQILLSITRSLGGRSWSLSPGRVMVSAVLLLLLSLIFTRMVPGIGGPLALAGLILFIVGYGMFFVKPSKIEKRWRGQPIEYSRGSWWDRIRRKPR